MRHFVFQACTEDLIDMYHQERLNDQLQVEFGPFGTLSVRVYFNHDCVFVEVIRAKNVLPLDNNGELDHHCKAQSCFTTSNYTISNYVCGVT